jgi:hypothetical protein
MGDLAEPDRRSKIMSIRSALAWLFCAGMAFATLAAYVAAVASATNP